MLEYRIKNGDNLNVWMVSRLLENPYIAPLEIMDEESAAIQWPNRVYPVEKHYHRHNLFAHATTVVPPVSFDTLYYPFECRRVDFSKFWSVPTAVELYARACFFCDSAGTYRFGIETAGAMKIWVNGILSDQFEVYRYHEEQKTIELQLESGENEIVVGCANIGHRDTRFGFRMESRSEKEFTVKIPYAGRQDNVEKLALLLNEAQLNSLNYYGNQLEIYFSTAAWQDIDIEVRVLDVERTLGRGDIVRKMRLEKGKDKLSVCSTAGLWIGMAAIVLSIEEHGIVLNKQFAVEFYPDRCCRQTVPDSIVERKKYALQFLGMHGNDSIQKVRIGAHNGKLDANDLQILEKEMQIINERHDCSDFRYPCLCGLYSDYAGSGLFGQKLERDIKETILKFRFWYDEPGNDVMWFFSENHALCFHTSQLLAGELFPDETFCNGLSGRENQEIAKSRLVKWFADFLTNGLNEWNSATYIPIDTIGLFALFDYTEDENIRSLAAQGLDMLFGIIAENCFKGVMSCCCCRTYTKSLLGRKTGETTALSWIAWGEGYLNNQIFSTVAFCLSDYQPPQPFLEVAVWGKKDKLITERVQGKKNAHTYLCKTAAYSMSSVINYLPGSRGVQEHVFEAAVKCADLQLWLNHPGEIKVFGESRPGYFAGNGTVPKVMQVKNVMGAFYELAEDSEVHFTHICCPLDSFDSCRLYGNWLVMDKDDVTVLIYAMNGLEITAKGILKGKEIISRGRDNFWLVKIDYSENIKRDANWLETLAAAITVEADKVIFDDIEQGRMEFTR